MQDGTISIQINSIVVTADTHKAIYSSSVKIDLLMPVTKVYTNFVTLLSIPKQYVSPTTTAKFKKN